MKRLSNLMKWGLAALFIATLPVVASAQLKRLPDVPQVNTRDRKADAKAIANFKKFFQQRGAFANSNNQVEPAPTSFMNVKAPIRQRPQNMFKSPADPSGNILAVVPSHSESGYQSDAYLGKLDMQTRHISRLYTGSVYSNGEEYYYETGAVRNGLLYIPNFSQNMVTSDITITWKVIDVATGERKADIDFGSGPEALQAFFYAMTYDEENDLFYGLSLNLQSGTGGLLTVVDPKKKFWEAEVLCDVGGVEHDFMCSLVWNPTDGMLYGLKDTGTLFLLDSGGDKYFYDQIEVRQYDDFDEYFMYPEWFASNAMCYSPYDHAFVFVYRDSFQQQMQLCTIDVENNFEPYMLGEITPLAYIATMVCTDPYAEDDAPNRMEAPVVSFNGPGLSGSYSITLPATTFNGMAIGSGTTLDVTVTLDGNALDSFSGKAGETFTKNITTTQGLHTLEVVAAIGELMSPKASAKFYAGYDQPLPPSDLKLEGNVLSWTASPAGGQNGGFVDADALAYDIYFNNVKQNTAPVSGTSFTFDQPSKLERKSITVRAVANGVESEPSSPLSRTVGEALALPFSAQPKNKSEYDLFETFNANGDENVFRFYTDWEGYNCITIRTGYYYQMPDDWVFLPALYFDDADALYNLTVMHGNAYKSDLQLDNLDIMIGTAPTPESMQKTIYTHSGRNVREPKELTVNFAIDKPGEYVIGFHSKPGDVYQYRGIQLYDFNVSKLAGANTKAPGIPTDIKFAADRNGDLYVTVSGKMPTIDILGRPLDAATTLTATASSPAGKNTASGKPGQDFSILVPMNEDGYDEVTVFCSSANGEGQRTTARVYAGLDTPLPPRNVRGVIDDDNLGIHITWDAPEGGAHGGYIDIDDLKYDIYTQGSIGSVTNTLIGHADGMEFDYRILPGKQDSHHVGPVARNSMGTSVNGEFLYEALGTPWSIPMVEEWGITSFNYSKWNFSTTGEYASSLVDHVSDMTGLDLGDPVFGVGGGLCVSNLAENGMPTRYQINCPKASTRDCDVVKTSIRVWDFVRAGTVELWGRTNADQEFKKITEFIPSRTSPQWIDWEFELPAEYGRKSWIQVNLRGTLENNQTMIFDNYGIKQDLDNDFAVSALEGPTAFLVGDEARFKTTLSNSGNEPSATNLRVELLGDGEVLESDVTSVGRTLSGDKFERTTPFTMSVDYLKYDKLSVRASIDDDNNRDNNVREIEIVLTDHPLPIVDDLRASRDGKDVVLTWSKPDAHYGAPESFEAVKPFNLSESLGLWTNIDLDEQPPFYIDAYRWEGDEESSAWVVINHDELGSADQERLSAHSGKQALLGRSIGYTLGVDMPQRSMDWLISPEVVGGTTVSFWFNILDTQYTETVELWYSSTDTRLDPENIETNEKGSPIVNGSFKRLYSYSKSGSELWEKCEYRLPDDAKYFALVYGSIGMFGALVDDIEFTPANTYEWPIDSYVVNCSQDGGEPFVVANDVKDLTFRHNNDCLNSVYWIQSVVYENGHRFLSPASNLVSIKGSSVDEIALGATVAGGKGRVMFGNLAGTTANIYDASGAHIATVGITGDRQTVAVPAGVLAVEVNGQTYKVFVR